MKNLKIEFKWALLFIFMTWIWMFLERLAGLHDRYIDVHPRITMLIVAPSLLIYFLALKEKKQNMLSGKMTFMDGFISGLWITGFITLLTPLSQYIISVWITPAYFQNAIEYSIGKGTSRTDAEAYFNLKVYMYQATFSTPVMGTLTSAVSAYFMRSK
ncbi:MAG: DUF4199 domain-containing protein [Saprospiraceae bacterium]|nr:DUF4199 domain-containing protein [Saprospiraceae bacterium]